jgi:predicted MFS family arabinose efflux permease
VIAARHQVLGLYAAWNALMQFEWLRFAPITDATAAAYGVSASQVGLLSLLFPLLFLFLALPTGRLIDRCSLRALLRLTALAMTAGILLRWPSRSFGAVVAGQLVLAAAQPLVVSLLSKLTVVWFAEAERLRATSFGTISLLLGPALAFLLSAGHALPLTQGLDVVVVCTLALLTLLLVPADPDPARSGQGERWGTEIRDLLRDRGYRLLLALVFIGNGFASALFTWLESMLQPQGLNADDAGLVGLLVLAGGVTGMALLPRIPEVYAHLRPLLLSLLPGAAATTLMLVAGLPRSGLFLTAFLLGFAVQGPLPLIVELVTETAGLERAGTAASGFWLSANAGAAVLIGLLSPFADAQAWRAGAATLAAVLLLQAGLAAAFVNHRQLRLQSR